VVNVKAVLLVPVVTLVAAVVPSEALKTEQADKVMVIPEDAVPALKNLAVIAA